MNMVKIGTFETWLNGVSERERGLLMGLVRRNPKYKQYREEFKESVNASVTKLLQTE